MQRSALVSIAGIALASAVASAGPAGFGALSFVEVDNGGVSDGTGANLASFRTFDLFWENTSGDTALVNGVNMGFAPNPALDNYFLRVIGGTVFNHAFGSDVPPNPGLFPAFPALEFDTYLMLGDATIAVVPDSVDLTGASNGEIRGVWFTQPPLAVANGESLRLLRLTVSDSTEDIRGRIQIGFTDGVRDFFIPAPGAAGVLALGVFAATRRRRA